MQSGAGLTSAIGLLGQPATFKDADAGLAVRAIARNRIANPAIVIDEVDKTGSSDWNGDPRLALLNFLEPESAQRTYDQFLQVHIDCSHVHWIFTANSLEGLPEPLLSRVQIFHIQRPGENALPAILKGFREDFAKRFGIAAGRLPQVDELLHHRLRIELNKGADLRRLRGIFESELKARATNSHRAIPHRNAN
jgi:ATP-dependent Lon protease